MSVKNRTFSAWSRDHHKTFAAAIATELEKKANLDSPHFIGIPTAPTPEPGTKDNQIATTEFVADIVGSGVGNDDKVSKYGDTIEGQLIVGLPTGSGGQTYPLIIKGKYKETSVNYNWRFGMSTVSPLFYLNYNGTDLFGVGPTLGIFPASSGFTLGYYNRPWSRVYAKKLNTGNADIDIPEKVGTMALLSDIEDTLRRYNLIPEQETNEEQN